MQLALHGRCASRAIVAAGVLHRRRLGRRDDGVEVVFDARFLRRIFLLVAVGSPSVSRSRRCDRAIRSGGSRSGIAA